MTMEEAIWWVNHLFEIQKEEYFNKGMMEDAKEVEEAQHMVIEALQERTRCKDCKHYIASTKGCGRNPCIEAWERYDFCSYGEGNSRKGEQGE